MQRPTRTLETSGVLERGGNCFGFLRLVLATMVIVSHTWTIGGFGSEPLTGWNVSVGFIGVYGFFALSGALVAKSADGASGSLFLWHRVRRIFPAFWACLIVTAFAIAPLITIIRDLPLDTLSPASGRSPYTYFTTNFLLDTQQDTIGHVLRGLPTFWHMNGSLWTLAYEFFCYLVVFVIVRMWVAAGRRTVVLVLVLATAIVLGVSVSRARLSNPVSIPLLGDLNIELLYPLLATFLVGAAMALCRAWVPFTPRIVAVCGFLVAISIPLDVFSPYAVLLMPYVIFGLGAYLPRSLRPVGTKNDFSYGLYLYGFPAGQILVAISVSFWSPATLAIGSIALAGAFAVASWFVIERWFLRRAPVPVRPKEASRQS